MNNMYIWKSYCITVKMIFMNLTIKFFCPTNTGDNFWGQRVSIALFF